MSRYYVLHYSFILVNGCEDHVDSQGKEQCAMSFTERVQNHFQGEELARNAGYRAHKHQHSSCQFLILYGCPGTSQCCSSWQSRHQSAQGKRTPLRITVLIICSIKRKKKPKQTNLVVYKPQVRNFFFKQNHVISYLMHYHSSVTVFAQQKKSYAGMS